jgi:hypothetical protein
MKAARDKVLTIAISWSKRVARVTSHTGGHVAQCLDLGDKMEITITRLQPAGKRGKR